MRAACNQGTVIGARMEHAKAKTVRRTQISDGDFRCAMEFIDAARRRPIDTIEYEALMHAAIIAYARPFSLNEKSDDALSDPRLNIALVAFDGADRTLHHRIIALRNKVVAHAESAQNPVEILAMKSDATIADGFSTHSQRWDVVNEQIDLDAFHRIADAMCRRCTDQMLDTVFPGSRQSGA
jgi:hypothetical protein